MLTVLGALDRAMGARILDAKEARFYKDYNTPETIAAVVAEVEADIATLDALRNGLADPPRIVCDDMPANEVSLAPRIVPDLVCECRGCRLARLLEIE